jgi:protein-tyrosine-phosphatase
MTARNGGDRRAWPLRLSRRAARWLLDLPDRTLHTARRALARRRLRSLRSPRSVLFVCHGNICRSPYAEQVLRRANLMQGRNTVISSAGFVGPDRPSPPEAVTAAAARGVDLTGHRSRLMRLGELRATDLVVVMEARQQRDITTRSGRSRGRILVLGDLDPERIERRTIRDPWGRDVEVFSEVYERIDRCVQELARELNRGSVVQGGGVG